MDARRGRLAGLRCCVIPGDLLSSGSRNNGKLWKKYFPDLEMSVETAIRIALDPAQSIDATALAFEAKLEDLDPIFRNPNIRQPDNVYPFNINSWNFTFVLAHATLVERIFGRKSSLPFLTGSFAVDPDMKKQDLFHRGEPNNDPAIMWVLIPPNAASP